MYKKITISSLTLVGALKLAVFVRLFFDLHKGYKYR